MTSAIELLDSERLELNKILVNKSLYSQYLTPLSVARFMASLFDPVSLRNPSILDAGAGIGTLTASLLERITSDTLAEAASCTAIEIDPLLGERIAETVARFKDELTVDLHLIPQDFIEWGTSQMDEQNSLFDDHGKRFSHIILNPPYKKMNSASHHRKLLSGVGIETVNLYTAFMALAIKLLDERGQLVAIVPRSFCNGPYYKPFRELLLSETAIRQIHLFTARDKAFQDDSVLQENVILHLERGVEQGEIKISTSTDDNFSDYDEKFYPFDRVVKPGDAEKFIYIPTNLDAKEESCYAKLTYRLQDLSISVSTGPVVGFRVKEHLRMEPEEGTVPLLYPVHIEREGIRWPKVSKKANAIVYNQETEKWLYPSGSYVMIRRFSSKEEKRRIFSAVTHPEMFTDDKIGFENGVNVLHKDKQGMPLQLAYGLHVYMNSSLFDNNFRSFNGHTQVNATDLRSMYFPSEEVLNDLGFWYVSNELPEQNAIDEKVMEVLS